VGSVIFLHSPPPWRGGTWDSEAPICWSLPSILGVAREEVNRACPSRIFSPPSFWGHSHTTWHRQVHAAALAGRTRVSKPASMRPPGHGSRAPQSLEVHGPTEVCPVRKPCIRPTTSRNGAEGVWRTVGGGPYVHYTGGFPLYWRPGPRSARPDWVVSLQQTCCRQLVERPGHHSIPIGTELEQGETRARCPRPVHAVGQAWVGFSE
jgi:hypothetical protein